MLPKTRQSQYLPELDGIRGLAILGVLCSHGVGVTGLFATTNISAPDNIFEHLMVPLWGGVDLFFALSGFLITGILVRTKGNQNYFSSFYARRALRIFPIYYLVLLRIFQYTSRTNYRQVLNGSSPISSISKIGPSFGTATR
jgi:peptidoglycan/LPS O-acetylase OafA/YrhL